jgi:carboxypeptidase C (cathepsin A)
LQKLPLLDVLSQSEEFASHDYRSALFEGDRMSADRKNEIADRLANLIGLSKKYVFQLNDEVPFNLFDTHLLGDENKLIGRYDSRYTGLRYSPGRDTFEFDPSYEAVVGPFTATFNDYARRELHFESDFPYEVLADFPWNWRTAENKYLDVAQDLRKAMIRNPYLKVWVCCGYYDLATPYFASKYTVDQMSLDPSIRRNIRLTYYQSGHMLYVNKPCLVQFKSDFQNFLKDSLLPDSSAVPTADR